VNPQLSFGGDVIVSEWKLFYALRSKSLEQSEIIIVSIFSLLFTTIYQDYTLFLCSQGCVEFMFTLESTIKKTVNKPTLCNYSFAPIFLNTFRYPPFSVLASDLLIKVTVTP